MAGTREGGIKARNTTYSKFGKNFYKNIGAMASHPGTGGFASDKVGKDGLTGKERARKFGAIGGRKSKRGAKCSNS
jgi:hypothetical protein